MAYSQVRTGSKLWWWERFWGTAYLETGKPDSEPFTYTHFKGR